MYTLGMADAKKFERLFDIYNRFVHDGFAIKQEIAKQYNVSNRSIERDISDLINSFAITILYDSNSGKYAPDKEDLKKLRDGYNFSDNPDKKIEKMLAVFLKKVFEQMTILPTMLSSKLLPPQEYEEYYDIITVGRNPISKIPGNEQDIENLLEYTRALQTIRFKYYTTDIENAYMVDAIPFVLHYFHGRWYMVAEDISVGVVKKYVIEKISSLQSKTLIRMNNAQRMQHEEECKKREVKRRKVIEDMKEKQNIFWNTDTPTETVVCFDSEVAHYFLQNDFGFSQKIRQKKDDGSVVVEFQFSSFLELWHFLSSWLGCFSIVSPDTFRSEMKDHLNKALKKL